MCFLLEMCSKSFSISDGSIYWNTMAEDDTLFVTYHGSYFMWFRGSVTEWLPTPCIIHHTCLPIHRPPSLSNSHKLCARLAISTAEIWDACNYRAIFSNQLDPNLYFPTAPAGLLASSYLLGRCSPHFCFLIRFPLALFQQGGKRRSSCDTGFKKVKGSKRQIRAGR